MAEERLIDEDKDRKYRLRINENGEEELVMDYDGGSEGEGMPADGVYSVPDVEDVQAAAAEEERRRQLERERKQREEEAVDFCDKAKRDCIGKRFASALEYLDRAEKCDPTVGEIYALRLTAYTRNYTDYSQIVAAGDNADGIANFVSEDRKAEIYGKVREDFDSNIAALRHKVTQLDKENEQSKAERAAKFGKDRNFAICILAISVALFVAFICTAVHYYKRIDDIETNLYLAYTILFAVLAVVALIGAAFAGRLLNVAIRRLIKNKRNTSTQLGRELLVQQEKLRAFINLSNALQSK